MQTEPGNVSACDWLHLLYLPPHLSASTSAALLSLYTIPSCDPSLLPLPQADA